MDKKKSLTQLTQAERLLKTTIRKRKETARTSRTTGIVQQTKPAEKLLTVPENALKNHKYQNNDNKKKTIMWLLRLSSFKNPSQFLDNKKI